MAVNRYFDIFLTLKGNFCENFERVWNAAKGL